jgi:hypothetical protein
MKKIVMIIIFLTPHSFADYHYASHTGSNTYPYTSWESAADTIQSAIDAAEPRDTVYIGSGEYEQIIRMQAWDSLMAIIGSGADSTHIICNQYHTHLAFTAHKTFIKGISFSNTGEYDCIESLCGRDLLVESCRFYNMVEPGGAIKTCAGNIIIRNCIFEDYGGLQEVFTDNISLEVSNCLFRDMYVEPIYYYSYHAVIKNNIVINQMSGGSPFFVICSDSCYSFIANNIIYKTSYGGMIVGIRDTTSQVFNNSVKQTGILYGISFWTRVNWTCQNNIITEGRKGIELQGNNRLGVYFSDLWRNSQGDFRVNPNFTGIIDTTLGLLHVDPMFNNSDSGDFRLQAYSPLIDAGDPNILDVDGSRSDIGAFGGPGGYFYEYQDLSPKTPDSLRSLESEDTLPISWTMNTEADFYRYIVWRDSVSGFTPWAGNIISEPDTNFIYDLNWDRFHNYYYRVAAYDNQGNLSLPSSELAVINVGIWGEPLNLPYTTYIETNYPNPFNNATTIVFYAADVGPQPGEIEITIYDIGGRKIRTLYSGREEVGEHRISWDGRDDSNRELPSGVYFARISQWGIDFINHPRKLVLVK